MHLLIFSPTQNSEYVIISGAKKKVETWDPAENGTLVLTGSSSVKSKGLGETLKI